MGAELGLRLAVTLSATDSRTACDCHLSHSYHWRSTPSLLRQGHGYWANSWCTPIPKGELARHSGKPLVARPTVLLRAGLDDGVPETTPTDRETKARGRLDHWASTGYVAMCSDIVVCRLDTVTEWFAIFGMLSVTDTVVLQSLIAPRLTSRSRLTGLLH